MAETIGAGRFADRQGPWAALKRGIEMATATVNGSGLIDAISKIAVSVVGVGIVAMVALLWSMSDRLARIETTLGDGNYGQRIEQVNTRVDDLDTRVRKLESQRPQ